MNKLIINIKTFLNLFRQLMAILDKKQRLSCIVLLLGVFACGILELLGISALIPFVLVLLSPDTMMSNRYVLIISNIFNVRDYNRLLLITALMIIIVYFLKNIALLGFYYWQALIHNQLERDLMIRQYKKFMSRPYAFYLRTNSVDVAKVIHNDTGQVAQVLDGFVGIISEGFTMILIGVYIIAVDPVLALVLIGTAMILAVFFVLVFKDKTSYYGAASRDIYSARYKTVLESVSAYKEISVNQKKRYFINRYSHVNEEACRMNTAYLMIQKSPAKIIECIFVSVILVLACYKVSMGQDTANLMAALSAIAVAAIRLLPMISSISGYATLLVYNRVGTEATYENIVLDRKNNVNLEAGIDKFEDDNSEIDFEKSIIVDHVSFRYENTDIDILKDVSLSIDKNKSIAFIGESGAGKSTLIDVVLGLLKPYSGKVYMDGHDISTIPKNWAKQIGYVPQSIYLMDDTVRRNIAFGIEDADIDDDHIWEVLKEAQLDEFIRNLPDGLDTTVGERGVRFSGGQRQRIAIARALYHDPSILVLDEATSALDNKTEAEVMEAIDSFHGRLTIIIVAHRLSTIENCDKVYVVGNGDVYERK